MVKVISKTKAELVIKTEFGTIKIPIHKREIGNENQDTILASDLYNLFKAKTDLAKWSKRHIIENKAFLQNEDFQIVWGKFNKDKFDFVDISDFSNKSIRSLAQKGLSKNIILTYDCGRELAVIHDRTLRKTFLKAYDKLQEITKNGFYISPESLANPSKKLIKISSSIMQTRKATILKREELYSRVEKFLDSETGYKPNSLNRVISTVYQHLHIATSLKTAVLIIQENLINSKNGLKINSYNPKQEKAYDKDYKIAINCYTEKQLSIFDGYFQKILEEIVMHLDSPHTKSTSKSVINILKNAGIRQIQLVTDLDFGASFQGKARSEIDDLVDEYQSEKIKYSEMVQKLSALRDGKVFKI